MMKCVRTPVMTTILSSAVALSAASVKYRVNPEKSSATIHVGKAGMFSFIAGHTHEVRGPIQSGTVDVDLEAPASARIELAIAAADLKVLPEGEPEGDAPKVQEAMDGAKVLDVSRFQRITFESKTVAVNNRHGNVLELTVAGALTIRDVTQPVTAPVRVEAAGGLLTASGRFAFKQSAFGITPISIGGVVAVKDTLQIDFTIVATK